MKTILSLLIGIVLSITSVSGQNMKNIEPLSIGDTVPNIMLSNIVNYKTFTADLSDFKDQLVILDFWATWCAPCVESLPKYQELQKKFKNKIQFLLVSPPSDKNAIQFLKSKNIELPSFVKKELDDYFPHNSVPHEVWIMNGIVVAITHSIYVTAENIQKMLSGEKISLPEKKANFGYDIFKPLLLDGNGGSSKDLLYHSVIAGYLDGIIGEGAMVYDSNMYKIRSLNSNVSQLYKRSVLQYDNSFWYDNRILIEAKEKQKFIEKDPDYYPSIRSDFYSYELILPSKEKEKAGRYMMEDLNRYFGSVYNIKGAIEKRKVLCWVLRKDNSDLITHAKSKGGTPKIIDKEGYQIWENQPFDEFFSTLAYVNRKQPQPFVNKTNLKENIDIIFPLNLKDVPAFQTYLIKYGLTLTQEECDIDMLVIKDVP